MFNTCTYFNYGDAFVNSPILPFIGCSTITSYGGAQVLDNYISLDPAGGVITILFFTGGYPDKLEIYHGTASGVKKATSSMTSGGNYGPFDNTWGIEPTNLRPTEIQASAVTQFIGTNKGGIPERRTQYTADTGLTITTMNYPNPYWSEYDYQQVVWWKYTAIDYGNNPIATIRATGLYSGSGWSFYRLCLATLYSVGDLALGGIIAYILQSGDPGYNPSIQHGFVATVADISTGAEWGCFTTSISGADGTSIGTGNQNTIDIIAGCATPGTAARLCADLVEGGYSDWYLPSVDELSKLYTNRVAIGNFDLFQFYWTSSEFSNTIAYSITFYNGTVNDTVLKSNNNLNVRPIRTF